jgi:hypothetical protein
MGKILDALLGFVAAINVDAGISVSDRVGWGVGILGHFFSPPLPEWGNLSRREPEERVQAHQILARLESGKTQVRIRVSL